MTDSKADERREIRSCVTGYVLALLLSAAAFAVVRWPVFGAGTLMVIFALALIQAIVHFRFFLHIDFKSAARDDLQLILFSAVIVVLMVFGTLVVLLNLRHRM